MTNINNNIKTPILQLRSEILKMYASGANGFEGLVRDLFERLLERTVYLMKSGTQGGGDAYTGTFPNQLTIVWEAKRYDSKTTLPIDQLVAKLEQACKKYQEMDIWLLLSTKEMSAQDIIEIEKKGEENGIGTLVLDWPENELKVSKIAALCATFPDVVKKYNLKVGKTVLAKIRKDPQVQPVISEIKHKLSTPHFSYLYHHDYSNQYLSDAFKNKDLSYRRLGCYGDIKTSKPFVCRKSVSKALDKWWSNTQEQFAIIHGTEGNGKSWAVFDWISTNLNKLPITLVLPAQKLEKIDVLYEVARALKRTIPNDDRSIDFYEKQIARWKSHLYGAIKLLIVIDGLNQNYSFKSKYENFLLDLTDGSWLKFIKIIITVRTGFLSKCGNFQKIMRDSEGIQRAIEIEVPKFDTSELKEFLLQKNINVEEIDQTLLSLITIPRYATLALQHSEKLKGIQECTVEHLMLIDWQDRIERQGKGIASNEFFHIIKQLAYKYHSSFSTNRKGLPLQDIKEIVINNTNETDNDLVALIDELSQDSWLFKGQKDNLFEFKNEWITPAFALVLINQLEKTGESSQVEDVFASFIEPLNNNDYVSKIIFSSLLLTLIREEKQRELSYFLVEKFLKLQNHDNDTIEQFYKIALINFEFYTSVLENNIKNNDEQLVNFLNRVLLISCQKDIKNETNVNLRILINKWLGTYTCIAGDIIHPLQEDDLNKLLLEVDEKKLHLFGITFSKANYYHDPYQFNLLSTIFIDEQSFPGVLARLLIGFLPDTLMQWLLRWNCTEEIMSGLISYVEKIGQAISTKQKSILLEQLAYYSARPEMLNYVYLNKPVITWQKKYVELSEWSLNPEFKPSFEDENYVNGIFNDWNLNKQNSSMFQSLENLEFEYLKPYFARFKTSELVIIEEKILAEKVGIWQRGQITSLKLLQKALIVLAKTPFIEKILNDLIANPQMFETFKGHHYFSLVLASVSALKFKQQLQFIKNLPDTTIINENIRYVLDYEGYAEDEFEQELLTCEKHTQVINLFYIGLFFPIKHLSIHLKNFIIQKTKENNELLASYAIKWVVLFGEKNLKCKAYEMIKPNFDHKRYLDNPDHLNLVLNVTPVELAKIENVCHPQFFPVVIKARGYLEADLKWFAELINTHVEAMASGSNVIPIGGWSWFIPNQFDTITFDKVIETLPTIIDNLELLAKSSIDLVTAFNEFPLVQLCAASWKIAPSRTEFIWISLFNKMRQSSSMSQSFKKIPFSAAANFEQAIDLLFHSSNTDFELLELSIEMQKCGKDALVAAIINKALFTDLTAVKAKGLVLAGFFCECTLAESLWVNIIKMDYSFGWLKKVRDTAYANYQKGKWAYYWFMKYLRSETDQEAYCYYLLFEANYDLRVNCWFTKNVKSWNMSRKKAIFFDLQITERKHILDKKKNELKGTLGFEKISDDIFPWWS